LEHYIQQYHSQKESYLWKILSTYYTEFA
jgi:hypothetical protein